ncbi:MAG: hypothetical protein R2752_14670 [Vicinamibacterales bacterium]
MSSTTRNAVTTCSTCGARIAEKAIVCYRCGTPTAIPEAPVRPGPPPRRGLPWLTILTVLAIIAVGVWTVPMTPEDSWQRMATFAGLAVATFVGVRLTRPRRPAGRGGPHRVD